MTDFADLLAGYQRFRSVGYPRQLDRWSELSRGQAPKVMVIACSDSRVDPAQIFDTHPGEIFVVRNIANLVPPFEDDTSRHGVSAALEFAVCMLKVQEIVILGHAACGGVHACMSQKFSGAAPGEGGFISNWVGILDEARARVIDKYGVGPEAIRQLEMETVRVSIANLRTFPFIPAAEEAGHLRIKGAYFAIHDGVLHVMGDDGTFVPA